MLFELVEDFAKTSHVEVFFTTGDVLPARSTGRSWYSGRGCQPKRCQREQKKRQDLQRCGDSALGIHFLELNGLRL